MGPGPLINSAGFHLRNMFAVGAGGPQPAVLFQINPLTGGMTPVGPNSPPRSSARAGPAR